MADDTRRNEEDRLRLAILKERADYRAFWDKHNGDKMATVYQEYLNSKRKDNALHAKILGFSAGLQRFGIKSPSLAVDSFFDVMGYADRIDICLAALNPYSEDIPQQISKLVHRTSSIRQMTSDCVPGCCEPLDVEDLFSLKPFERLLRVDISRKRSELIEDFCSFLDEQEQVRDAFSTLEDFSVEKISSDAVKRIVSHFTQWEPDKSRYRDECWRHLEVWKLRRQKKSYLEISRKLKIRVDAARKSMARAYELIEDRKYDQVLFKNVYLNISTAELKKTCKSCPERANCEKTGDLCPDMLSYVDQDYVSQRELLIEGGTLDYLSDLE